MSYPSKNSDVVMHLFKSLITLEDAQKLVRDTIHPIERVREHVPLLDAIGAVLAHDIVAGSDVPPFDRAAMDGYAVKAMDTVGATLTVPIKLRCIDKIYAGESSQKTLSTGDCIQVATGSPMPQGSDAVVIVEDTESTPHKGDAEEPDIISIFKPVYPGANVSSRGEDILKGSCALKCGTVLTPAKIGVVAALGISEVTVYDKPIVSIIPTGDEIAELGGEITPTQVYDVNSYTLAVLVEQNGGRAVKYPIVSDTYDALRSVIHRAVASSDLVVLSGGSSVGERDVILDVLSELGTVLFHGIQIKPGKPTLCGVVNNKLVWGMPGYPTSCLINGYILLVPVLRALARLPEKRMVKVSARLAHRYASTLGRLEFVPVKLVGNEAVPVFKESGAITSMANADGYFEIPANMDLVEKGDEIVINLF